MARIGTYNNDETITGGDKILGTDLVGNATSNFTVADLKEYIESGVDVTISIPPYFVPVINATGTDTVVSSVRELRSQATQDITYTPTGTNEDSIYDQSQRVKDIRLVYAGGGTFLEIVNWTSRFDIMSLIGKLCEGVFINGDSSVTVRMTIGEVQKFTEADTGKERDFLIDEDGDIVFRFAFTAEDEFDFAGAVNSYTSFTVKAEDNDNKTLQHIIWNFYGDAQFANASVDTLKADRVIFDKTNDPDVAEEGLFFGDPDGVDPYTELTYNMDHELELWTPESGDRESKFVVDAETEFKRDLSVDGAVDLNSTLNVDGASTFTSAEFSEDVIFEGNVTQLNSGTKSFRITELRSPGSGQDKQSLELRKNSITLADFDGITRPIEFVAGNDSVTWKTSATESTVITDEGTLTHIQIGTKRFNIPTSVSQVAQQLPGLYEELSPKDPAAADSVTFTTGQWFYGTDEGTFAKFKSKVTVAAQTIQANQTTHTVPSGDRSALQTVYAAIPLGQRLFFVESDNTFDFDTAAVDTDVTGNTYEVTVFVNSTGFLQFSKLSAGNIIISAAKVTINNVPQIDEDDDNTYSFVTLTDDNALTYRPIEEVSVPFRQRATYADTEDDSTGAVSSIDFVGNEDNVAGGSGNVTVDVSGRVQFDQNILVDNFSSAVPFRAYVLGTISATKTFTLPSVSGFTSGEIIRIINLSDIGSAGQQVTSELWSVAPHSGDRIMKLPLNESVQLNEATQTDFIWSGISSVGWIIMQ